MILDAKHPTIRIYKTNTLNAPYFDPAGMVVSAAVIEMAENSGGGVAFSITNPYEDSAASPLSPDFSGWSDNSTGKIGIGMYVRFEMEGSSIDGYLMDGRISEIVAKDRTIAITVADLNSIMGRQGLDVFRNFVSAYVSNEIAAGSWDDSESKLKIHLPAGVTVNAGAAEWGIPEERTFSKTHEPEKIISWSRGSVKMDGVPISEVVATSGSDASFIAVKRIKAAIQHRGYLFLGYETTNYGYSVDLIVSDGVTTNVKTVSISYTGTPSSQYSTVDLDLDNMGLSGSVSVSLRAYNFYSSSSAAILRFYIKFNVYDIGGTSTSVAGATYAGSLVNLEQGITEYRTVSSGAQIGSTYRVDSITGISSINASFLLPSLSSRHARISYATGKISTTPICNLIADANGYIYNNDHVSGGNQVLLSEFRTGGGHMLGYLQVLCDMTPDGNICRAFRAVQHAPGTTPLISFGDRTRSPGSPAFNICYGGVGHDLQNRLQMLEFEPKITIRDRPSESMVRCVRSIGGAKIPIIAVMRDDASAKRRTFPTIEMAAGTDMSDFPDAVNKAWSGIRSNDAWEGEVTITGIHTGMISHITGRGATVAIHDPRYSMNDYHAIVKSVVLDCESQTTKVTLTNHGEKYGNAIKSSGTMALMAGNAVTDDAAKSLYATQYVRLVTDTVIPLGGNMMRVNYTGGYYELPAEGVAVYPDGSRALYYGVFSATDTHYTSTPNAVHAIRINGVTIPIPESRRPDMYKGQTLVVNVDAPII